MAFSKYQHIERLGTPETEGILDGICFVFPKLDGTNCQVWYEDGVIKAGSRNREILSPDEHFGFLEYVRSNDCFERFFSAFPDIKLYGEFLVPHTLRTYDDTAWRKFYVFDVVKETQGFAEYVPYVLYQQRLELFGLDYIPPICKCANATYEGLLGLLENNTYLIKDGCGVGEGIVIKNYDYKNKYGRVIWAKLVRNEFKAKHAKSTITELKEKALIEQAITDKFLTSEMIKKEYAKICAETDWSSKLIPRLLSTVFYTLIKEESWNYVKAHKNPTIDFSRLNHFTVTKVKETLPELF